MFLIFSSKTMLWKFRIRSSELVAGVQKILKSQNVFEWKIEYNSKKTFIPIVSCRPQLSTNQKINAR